MSGAVKTRAGTYFKMAAVSLIMVVGGPALILYVMPSEEEIFNRYSPELKRKALEERPKRMEEYQAFLDQMKEYSKSDKPIWVLQAEEAKRKRKEAILADKARRKVEEEKRAEMLKEQLEEHRR